MTRRRLQYALPLATVAALTLAVTVVTLPPVPDLPRSARWLPPDGDVAPTAEGTATWAVLPAGQLLPFAPPEVLAGAEDFEEALRWHWARRVEDRPGHPQRAQYLAAVEGGIDLVAVSGDRQSGLVPAARVVPDDLAPGRSWEQAGSWISLSGDSGEYRFTATSQPGSEGCVVVNWALHLGQGQPLTSTDQWCADRRDPAAGPPAPVRVTAATQRWAQATGWRATRLDLRGADGNPRAVSTTGPLLGGTALLSRTSRDVVAVDAEGQVVATMHPGGQVLVGWGNADAWVVGTDRREVVAFAASGAPAWRVPLGEVPTHLVPVGAGRLLAVDGAGDVTALDLATGSTAWRSPVGLPTLIPPAVHRDRILLTSDTGDIACLSATDGRELWRTTVAERPDDVALLDGVALVFSDLGDLEAFDIDDGTPLWRQRFDVGLSDARLERLGEDLLVATGRELLRVTAAGSIAWRRASDAKQLVVGPPEGSWAMAIGDAAAELVLPSGQVAAEFPLDPTVDAGLACAPAAPGVACTSVGPAPILRFGP